MVLAHTVFAGLMALFIGTGIRGIDLGPAFDEGHIIDALRLSFKHRYYFPSLFWYPTFCYYLTMTGALATFFWECFTQPYSWPALEEIVLRHGFLLRMRSVFLVISSLSLCWVYLLVRRWRRSWPEALLAAALTGLSWELAYHSRFLTTDASMVQFVVLTLLLLTGARDTDQDGAWKRWMDFAAMAGGLATGTKYNAVLVIVPILLTVHFKRPSPAGGAGKLACRLVLIFAAVYLLTTPGTFLRPVEFFQDLKRLYWENGFTYFLGLNGYTTRDAAEHFYLMSAYLSLVIFSKSAGAAFLLFLAAALGVFLIFREDKKNALVFFAFPVLTLILFGFQRYMWARRLLVLYPFLAIAAARGICYLYAKMSRAPVRRSFLVCAVALIIAFNAFWLVYAAESIARKVTADPVAQLAGYLDRYSSVPFAISKKMAAELKRYDGKARPNLENIKSRDVRAAILHSSEISLRWEESNYLANRFDYTWTWFGPYEVNFNYYPNWIGEPRVVVMPVRYARSLNLRWEKAGKKTPLPAR